MPYLNSKDGYGGLTKTFHWLIVLLFALQYIGGNIMTGMERGDVIIGLTQNHYYNWHKSLGLVALLIAVLRLLDRYADSLPPWAPTLTKGEKRFIHHAENVLYGAMFVMPVSGFVYVMAGGYGVMLFGEWRLPNPIGTSDTVEFIARWIHILSGWALLIGIGGHVGLVLRHQLFEEDNLLKRMLPFTRK